MTRTLGVQESQDAPDDRPAHSPVHPAPSLAGRPRRRPDRPARRDAAPRAAVEPADIEVRIEEGDSLLAFLQQAPGPMPVTVLPSNSPAVARLLAQGAQMVVPLVAAGELVGVVALGPQRSERPYGRNDRRLLDSLARYAAPALRLGQMMREQEREARERERIEQELQIAQLIQQQFLPSELPELGGWHVAAFYRPARAVGGDFYDIIPLPDGRVMVVTGDVTDKGVPAALVMASTTALLRSSAETSSSPGEVLHRVNELLIPQIPANMFVTCLVLVIDLATGRTRYANAGHNLPFVRRDGRAVRLDARGMPLGLLRGSRYDEAETLLEPDDIVLLYSDGITEQHNQAGEMFGFERTAGLVAASESGEDLLDRSVAALAAFAAGVDQEDDVTLVTLHRGRGATYRDTVQFAVPSVPGNEREVMDRVGAIVEGVPLAPPQLENLKTAVSETAMNAIEHGNRGRPELDVEVTVRRTAESVIVDVADFGRGPSAVADTPDIELKLAGLQSPRGWGLFLVEQLTDKVDEFMAGDRHVVRLAMTVGDGTSPEGDLA